MNTALLVELQKRDHQLASHRRFGMLASIIMITLPVYVMLGIMVYLLWHGVH